MLPEAGTDRWNVEPERVMAEGRIIEAVTGAGPITGTPGELAGQFDMGVQELLMALGELVAVGWVAVQTTPDGRLGIGWSGQHTDY